MSPLGIVVALPHEALSLTPQAPKFDEPVALPGGNWLVVSGCGPAWATHGAGQLLQNGICGLISWGCAGALAADLKPGTLIVPEHIIDADNHKQCTDSGWVHRLAGKLAGSVDARTDGIAESATILTSAADKSTLRQSRDAVAVDMESAAIARVARDAGLPFVAIRAVADAADSTLPPLVTKAADARGEVRLPALIGQLCLHPGQLPGLLKLKKDFDAAMATLRTVIDTAGADLQFSQAPTRG